MLYWLKELLLATLFVFGIMLASGFGTFLLLHY